ncbi:MAG: RluA family pseudouridine synthase [Gemmataceae bacterium]|nr:RluA family pseudouridine synthase [Gemmataceae bacterium]
MRTPTSIVIDRRLANRTLLELLQASFSLSRKHALSTLHNRQVRICGGVCIDPQRRVKIGQNVQLCSPLPPGGEGPGVRGKACPIPAKSTLAPIARQIIVRFVDEHLAVVEKPAGLTTVRHADEVQSLGPRAKKFLPPTLVDLLPTVLPRVGKPAKGRIRAVHRIDKETSGLVVLARTPAAESHLGKQFRAHTTGRHYLALVRGHAQDARLESHLVPDRGDGRRGGGAGGQLAITHVRAIEPLGEFTLVECRLETGRTHQVRIHLGEAGTPLCGERIYDRPLHGKPLPDASGAKRPMLHAAYLAIDHPATGKRMEWNSELPTDMSELVKTLKGKN